LEFQDFSYDVTVGGKKMDEDNIYFMSVNAPH